MAFYTCPRNAAHTRFYARFAETVCSFIDADGDRDADISNTYDYDGQCSDTWCYDCDHYDAVVTVAKESA